MLLLRRCRSEGYGVCFSSRIRHKDCVVHEEGSCTSGRSGSGLRSVPYAQYVKAVLQFLVLDGQRLRVQDEELFVVFRQCGGTTVLGLMDWERQRMQVDWMDGVVLLVSR